MKAADIAGTTWLITGASAGFGRAIAEEVLARGGRVVATARKPQDLEPIVAIAPDRVAAAKLDVTSEADIADCLKLADERFGGVDVLVNNAGHGFSAAVEEGSEREVRALFDVNVFGLAALTRAVLPQMRARRSGKIINFSSIAGVRGVPGVAYYCASKWAVEGLSEALAGEVAPFGIGVLVVEPGAFRTEFYGRSLLLPDNRIPAYEGAEAIRKMSSEQDGAQAGDPKRAATVIVDTAFAEKPPLRLILGRKVWPSAEASIKARLADMEFSRELSETCDFPVETA